MDLKALAFTLQTGRDAMACRAAVVADDPAVLGEALTALAEDRAVPPGVWVSGGEPPDPSVSLRKASRGERLGRLAAAWAAGAEVDWAARWRGKKTPRPLRLPTTPFVRERFWFAAPVASAAPAAPPTHPLFPAPPGADGGAVARLDPGGFYFADHRIGGRPVLPGVVSLELARVAAGGAGASALDDVVWLAPVAADDGVRALTVERDGAAFRIVDGAVRFCQGRIGAAPAPVAALDLAGLRAGCVARVSADACYARLTAAGIVHGPAFRAVEEIAVGVGLALADLVLPENPAGGMTAWGLPAWGLHPAMLDAAIQASVALLPPGAAAGLPFAVERGEFFAAALPRMVAVARASGGASGPTRRFDIDLCAPDGAVRARLIGLVTRPGAGVSAPADAEGVVLATPEWRARAIAAAAPRDGDDAVFLAARRADLAEPLAALLAVPVRSLPEVRDAADAAGAEAALLDLIAFLRERLTRIAPVGCWWRFPPMGKG